MSAWKILDLSLIWDEGQSSSFVSLTSSFNDLSDSTEMSDRPKKLQDVLGEVEQNSLMSKFKNPTSSLETLKSFEPILHSLKSNKEPKFSELSHQFDLITSENQKLKSENANFEALLKSKA